MHVNGHRHGLRCTHFCCQKVLCNNTAAAPLWSLKQKEESCRTITTFASSSADRLLESSSLSHWAWMSENGLPHTNQQNARTCMCIQLTSNSASCRLGPGRDYWLQRTPTVWLGYRHQGSLELCSMAVDLHLVYGKDTLPLPNEDSTRQHLASKPLSALSCGTGLPKRALWKTALIKFNEVLGLDLK